MIKKIVFNFVAIRLFFSKMIMLPLPLPKNWIFAVFSGNYFILKKYSILFLIKNTNFCPQKPPSPQKCSSPTQKWIFVFFTGNILFSKQSLNNTQNLTSHKKVIFIFVITTPRSPPKWSWHSTGFLKNVRIIISHEEILKKLWRNTEAPTEISMQKF